MVLDIPLGTRPKSDAEAILLAELLAATATTKERRNGFWVPVPSSAWREILGSRYKATIRDAVSAGYIEINDRYSVGRFSKSYRLAKICRRPETQEYILRRPCSTSARIRIHESDSVGRALVAQFGRIGLTAKASGWDGFCAGQIRKGSFYATRCQYGRFHSTVTGMKRQVRGQLSLDGHQVVEVDVANCQPLILGLRAAPSSDLDKQPTPNRLNTSPDPTTHSEPPTQQQPTPPTNTHSTHTYTTYTTCGALSLHRHIRNYIAICEGGDLYGHLERLCRGRLTLRDCIPANRWHRYAKDRPLRRKDVKRQFMVMLFANTATTSRMPIFDVAATEWPALADYILAAKKDCYQNLARDCQQLESRLMIDGAAGSLLADSSIPIVTIHDAILTTEAHVPAVEAAIIEEFSRLGVTPKTKLTRYWT